MSGFDDGWLALREPADHSARNDEVAARMRAHFAGRHTLSVVDLGCGTGSNLRALAPLLSPVQRWHLVDGDAALLDAARRRLADWADAARMTGDGMELERDGRRIAVCFECADLTRRDLGFMETGAELVTAAALFDLASREWIDRLVGSLARRRVPLYALLSYDGTAMWEPAHPLDTDILAAFNRHQQTDKGFGPALGPQAGETLRHVLEGAGYTVWSGDSPWELTPDHATLLAPLVDGIAAAAAEIDPAQRAAFEAWARDRRQARRTVIGHLDLFATL